MPPEQDDNRDRQLAALRRYVSDLDVHRQDDVAQNREREGRRRVAWPWLLVTLLLMAVSLGAGIAIGGRGDPGRDPTSAAAGATATSAPAPTASPGCAEAVERANQSISHAVRLSAALREHTEIMNDLLNGKISADTALKTGTPSLIAGSAESAKFDVALADYRRVVDRCQLRSP
ncbi:MAG TPA: hypothetical protein VFS70_06885 [Actinomycetota bacterium]|nr:hypothetical protein [Actinomycetota bacterium]